MKRIIRVAMSAAALTLGLVSAASAENLYGTTVPPTQAYPDSGAVNLGLSFKSSVDGWVTGVRFYKGTGNVGPHEVQLWQGSQLLAQTTSLSEGTTGWQDVAFKDPVHVTTGTTYVASYYDSHGNYAWDPNAPGFSNGHLTALPGASYAYGTRPDLPNSSSTGEYGVDVNFTATQPVETANPPRSGTNGNGSVLVLTDPNNPFSSDLCTQILPARGIACAWTDAGNVTSASQLSAYKTVIVGDATTSSTQVSALTSWVTSGGNLIVMRPSNGFDSLLGLGASSGPLADAYLKSGSDTWQFHGVADERPLAGATAVATLATSPSNNTSFPAISKRTVGSGTAIGWTFDLSRSNVYTREGNPDLQGKVTVSALDPNAGDVPRIMDRFGNGYLDTSQLTSFQADKQIGILIGEIEAAAPTPIKWEFPSFKPATHPQGFIAGALVVTGDDHGGAYGPTQTLTRFQSESAASPSGCSVADWTCLTSTSYAFPGNSWDAAAKPYTDNGFEVGPHVSDNGSCATNWSTRTQLDQNIFSPAMTAWQNAYPTIAAAHPPTTERMHCYGGFEDYASIQKVEASHGISMDTSASCWPPEFVTGACVFTGSGLPQTYDDEYGKDTGARELTTFATDENPGTITTDAMTSVLTDGPAYLTVLAHLDGADISAQTEANARSVAASQDVPFVSAAQAHAFIRARAGTGIGSITNTSTTLSFSVSSPAHNLMMLVPQSSGSKTVQSVTLNGTSVANSSVTVWGSTYRTFKADTSGTYVVTYG